MASDSEHDEAVLCNIAQMSIYYSSQTPLTLYFIYLKFNAEKKALKI
jgi:hypothetical protein